jgi:hypothetical protein
MNQIENIKRAIKKGDLGEKIVCWMLIKFGFSNYTLQALQIRNKNYCYLNKKYGKYLKKLKYEDVHTAQKFNDIWICWFQGMEDAPQLVKACYESVCRNMPNKNIHLITADNMFDYVDFPEWVVEKWKKGIISNAHLSDLLRTELLIRYGGLWLDATVYLTESVPNYITESELFMYTHSNPDDITISYNNWLIYSHKDNCVLKLIRSLLYEYWRKENKSKEYFFWHLFLTMIKEEHAELFANISYVTDELPETLARICFRKKDDYFFDELKKMTSVHKLSNKLDIPESIKGTYYEWVLNGKEK